jgi:Tfp pilus assembly protein PilZ
MVKVTILYGCASVRMPARDVSPGFAGALTAFPDAHHPASCIDHFSCHHKARTIGTAKLPPAVTEIIMQGNDATQKKPSISVITTRLVKLVLKMPYQERLAMLKQLEVRRNNISVVTERLIKTILKMPFPERRHLLDEMEEGIARGKRSRNREAYFTDVVFASKGKALKGYIRNISADGVFVETSEKVNVGQNITLSFALPNSIEHIKISGRIARTLPWGFGVRFHEGIQGFLEKYYKKNTGEKPEAEAEPIHSSSSASS